MIPLVARPSFRLSSLTLALAIAGPLQAATFDFADGEGSFTFDTQLSVGGLWRMESRDPRLVGIVNGGSSRSVNEDNGNLNYDKGDLVSAVLKGTHDVDLSYGNSGLFVRFGYAADLAAREKDELPFEAHRRLDFDAEMYDWYVRQSFTFGERTTNVRLGNQVVSWGEGALMQGGINAINPVDLQRLRVPGSELKEAFIPVPMVWASQQITDDISLEAFYQLKWRPFEIDPCGTYFSTTDVFCLGGKEAFVGFGRTPDRGPDNPDAATDTSDVPRTGDRDPREDGQFGVALRWLVGDTEIGLYGMNYHSRLPIGSLTAAEPGSSDALPVPISSLRNASTATVFAEYPEDIQLYGISFNTSAPFGIALSGEYSYRPNLPVQISTTELTLAALGLPSQSGTDGPNTQTGDYVKGYRSVEAHQLQLLALKAIPNILGAEQAVLLGEMAYFFQDLPDGILFNGPGVYIPGRSNSGTFKVSDLVSLPNFTYPNAIVANGSAQTTGYASKESFGFRLVGRLEYTDVFAGINLLPRLVYANDVFGVSQFYNEGAQSVSVGLSATYLSAWNADISYTAFFGTREFAGTDCQAGLPLVPAPLAGLTNILGEPACSVPTGPTNLPNGQPREYRSVSNQSLDRDFLAASLSYSF